ncbi:MAG TPA: LptF/LptG family permease [Blastocatellia bacterium]|nr:LptF/LptG family permease [Blastocatellia bacterium]
MKRSFQHNRLFFSLLSEIFPVTLVAFLALTSLVFVQQAGKYFNVILSFHTSSQVAIQFLWSLIPGIVVITLPVSLLLGTIITCSRLSTDGEMTAMQSLGFGKVKIALPFLCVGIAGAIFTSYLLAQVAPRALKKLKGLRAKVLLQEANAQVTAGRFITRFPNSLLYVRDIDPKTGEWVGVFLLRQEPDSEIARLITAEKGQLRITGGEGSERLGLEVELLKVVSVDSKIANGSQSVSAASASERASIKFTEQGNGDSDSTAATIPLSEMTLDEVTRQSKNAPISKDRLQASIEWHRRLAFPFACITLTLLTFIVALQGRRLASKPRTTVVVLFLAMLFYLLLVAGQNLAVAGKVPAWLGVWFSNLFFGSYVAFAFTTNKQAFKFSLFSKFSSPKIGKVATADRSSASAQRGKFSFPTLNPFNLVNYLLVSEIFKYYVIAVSALVVTSLVFTLFDLIPAMSKTGTTIGYAMTYLGYLSPQFIYQVSPFALLVGILTGCSVLARSNQLVTLSGAGLSKLRTVVPLMMAVVIIGIFLWAVSDYLLPHTNREQDFRYSKIKGRQVEQTTIAFGKKWVFGKNDTIYSYQRVENDNSLINASAYFLSPATHLIEKTMHFKQAAQSTPLTWTATGGWAETIKPDLTVDKVSLVENPQPIKIEDGISIFRRTVNESSKMDSDELKSYISQLKSVGASITAAQLDLKRRLSFPVSCLTLAVLAIPFALTRRGRNFSPLLSVAISVGIGLIFWLLMSLFEAAGQQDNLPEDLAVWGPQVLFLAIGLYLNFRQRAHNA